MLVLIDESGDTGFKETSSRYFVLAMVVFRDRDEETGRFLQAEKTSDIIEQTKKETGHKPEFHFSQCSHNIRHSFFNALNANSCEFEVYALVVDKNKIYSPALKANKKKFYNYLLKQLLQKNPIQNANIKIDGKKSTAFKQELKAYLKRGKDGMIGKLKFADSKNDSLIQLADMCCSGIAYKYNRADRLNSEVYVSLLGKRIKNIWEFQ
jgi:hypothetical protein